MAHTYDELRHKTVAELREIAKELPHEAVQGYTQMNKEHLLPAICQALGLDAHEHHAAAAAGKSQIKTRMREIKSALDAAGTDADRLHALRREYHHLNHGLRVNARRAPAR
jgi:DNA-binding IclR family transcriptional regulator